MEVPDHLWKHCTSGKGKKYSNNQAEDMIKENEFMQTFDEWVNKFATFVQQKGKVPPNKYRAYGHVQPSHLWADVKDGIRYFEMMVGKPPKGSSPKIQQDLGLNKDATWHTKKSEGKKLRGK